jgi:enamine deaminase RidA (YjgF/YER057c/UK114 family)
VLNIQAPFAVRYVPHRAAPSVLAHSNAILGVIGYGAERPACLPPGCPFVAAPLMPATGEGMLEIWTTAVPIQPCPDGPVVGAFGDGVAFAAIALNEAVTAPLEDVVEAAYGQIFEVLERIGVPVPVRFWNYLHAITEDDHGLQRYMRFNLGRQRGFSARLRQQIPPAASGVGSHRGPSTIYVLAAREAARPIENPRQISAYAYPPVYGPASPGFSRASLCRQGSGEALFVSGTASILGHETRHEGDVLAQIGETIENLRAVITAAGSRALPTAGDRWALKAYLRDAAYLDPVDAALVAMFGAESERLYLHADLCRPELLVEIEAFAMRLSDRGPPPPPVPC